MKNTNRVRSRRRGGGFSLVEALLAVAIMAILITALGAAVHAALENFRGNERIATASQVTRAVLNRMMREVRTAAAIEANSTVITIIPPDDGSGVAQIQYEYDPAAKALNYTKTVAGGVTHTYVACGEGGTLTAFSAVAEAGVDWQGLACVKNVRVTMTLKLGPESFTFASSASPRRNQLF
jgi:type II secretory pathway pseudopilin PulG